MASPVRLPRPGLPTVTYGSTYSRTCEFTKIFTGERPSLKLGIRRLLKTPQSVGGTDLAVVPTVTLAPYSIR